MIMNVAGLTDLIHVERSLDEAILNAEVYLNDDADSSSDDNIPSSPLNKVLNGRVGRKADFPRSSSDIKEILALAHTYASRLSAPVGWDGMMTVGFATPAPLPHQLRAGNVGGLQLRLAIKEKEAAALAARLKESEIEGGGVEEKRVSLAKDKRQLDSAKSGDAHQAQKAKIPKRSPRQAIVTSMNLSDSDDSSNDDSSEEDD